MWQHKQGLGPCRLVTEPSGKLCCNCNDYVCGHACQGRERMPMQVQACARAGCAATTDVRSTWPGHSYVAAGCPDLPPWSALLLPLPPPPLLSPPPLLLPPPPLSPGLQSEHSASLSSSSLQSPNARRLWKTQHFLELFLPAVSLSTTVFAHLTDFFFLRGASRSTKRSATLLVDGPATVVSVLGCHGCWSCSGCCCWWWCCCCCPP